MEADMPLSAVLLFYLAVFPCLWIVSSLIRLLIRTMAATRARPKPARPEPSRAPQPAFSSRVYETVTTRMA